MNTKLLGLLAAASLATAACSQEKKVETTTTAPVTDANTAVAMPDTMAAHDDARRLAARVAEDLKLTDTVVVTRLRRSFLDHIPENARTLAMATRLKRASS